MVTGVLAEVRNERLARFLAGPGRFAIYGTGAAGAAVTDALADHGLKPERYVDSYRTGEFRGREILSPEDAVEAGLDAVVTASMYARDMTAQLRGDGYEGPILDLTVAHDERWAGHFDEGTLDEARDELAFARSLLADEASRALLDAVLRHRRTLDPGDLPPSTPPYRHPEVPVEDGEWVLDVGAFDGETALAYAEAVGSLGRVYAFEPAQSNREALESAVAAHPAGGRVVVVPAGAWRRSGELAMGTGGPPSQFRVEADGDERIRVVSLDDFVWEHAAGRADWIKLDVEGAEHEALDGAKALLAKWPPKLAVCVYHRPHDLASLPIRLKEAVPGYRLYLGHHSQNLYDTVCYARPPASGAATGATTP